MGYRPGELGLQACWLSTQLVSLQTQPLPELCAPQSYGSAALTVPGSWQLSLWFCPQHHSVHCAFEAQYALSLLSGWGCVT